MTFVVTEACVRCKYTAFNAERAKTLPTISRVKPALPDAQDWAPVKSKRAHVGL